MKYKLLGRSGMRVSELCLGAMTFGEDWGAWGANKEESRKIFDTFMDAGGNFVDTANIYTNGTSETFLAEFMKGKRERVVLATKYTNAMPNGDPNVAGNHRKNLKQSLDASLKRLDTDYIDLYWVHAWDFLSPVDEVMRALDDAVRQGKILYVGISDAPAWIISRANTIADLRGWSPFSAVQLEYSLLERTIERELLPMAADMGLTVAAWGPLCAGVLTGKYLDDKSMAKGEGRLSDDMMKGWFQNSDKKEAVVRLVLKIAADINSTPSRVAIAWMRQKHKNLIPIIGAKKLSQLEDNLASIDITLSEHQMSALDLASAIDLGFPGTFYANDMVRAIVYGGMRELIEA